MTVVLLAVALLSGATYGAFRAGLLRWLGRYSSDPSAPLVVRNLPFMTLPVGAFALAGLSMSVIVDSGPVLGFGVLALLSALVVAFVMAATWLAWSPPSLFKPAWLRREDAAGHLKLVPPPPPASAADRRALEVSAPPREPAAPAPGAPSKWRFAWQDGTRDDRGDEEPRRT